MSKQVISIVMPDGQDPEKFAKKLKVELWNSHTLRHFNNLLGQMRNDLLDNKPVQAYNKLELIQQEIARITNDHET